MTPTAIKHAFLDNLFYVLGKFPALATRKDYYMALAFDILHDEIPEPDRQIIIKSIREQK